MTDIVPATLQRVSAVATLPAIAMRIMRIADDPTHGTADWDELLRVLKVSRMPWNAVDMTSTGS